MGHHETGDHGMKHGGWIKRRGRRRFRKLEDPAFMAFLATELLAGATCPRCGGRATERAHVYPKSLGKYPDKGNTWLACPTCHRETEGQQTPEILGYAKAWAEVYDAKEWAYYAPESTGRGMGALRTDDQPGKAGE